MTIPYICAKNMIWPLIQKTNPDETQLRVATNQAITSARRIFFSINHRRMYSHSFTKRNGKIYPCLVDSTTHVKSVNNEDIYGVFFQNDANLNGSEEGWEPTHRVTLASGIEDDVRLKYCVKDKNSELHGRFVDIFDVSDNGNIYSVTSILGKIEFQDFILLFQCKPFILVSFFEPVLNFLTI
jgi:hypothetical protein